MLTRRVIACLDVRGGRVVKGVKFEGLRDQGDPVECAARYDAEGADEITLLDITASVEGRGTLLDVVRRTAEATFTPLTVGGGVRSEADVEALLLAGADKVSLNTSAVADPPLVARCARRWGSQAIVVAVDARRTTAYPGGPARSWEVWVHGGRTRTDLMTLPWARQLADLGAGEILLTSMDRDGTKDGYDLELVREVSDAVTIPVVASGGVGTLEHLRDGVTTGHASAVLAASIFHEGTFTVAEVKRWLASQGIPVRELSRGGGAP